MFSLLLRLQMLQMLQIFVPGCTGRLRQMGLIVVTIKHWIIVLQQPILVWMGLKCYNYFLFSLVALRENMLRVTCHDVSHCLIGSRTSHGSRVRFRVRVTCSRSHFAFAFVIRDTIRRGMTWGDVTMNSFTFSRESCWRVTKSVAFLESL